MFQRKSSTTSSGTNGFLNVVFLLFIAAAADLVVGVSNDAANFLNSAIGSRVARRRTIMIVASTGLLLGAFASSGMMEVARKSIFNPDLFYFDEIMIVFIAVMLTKDRENLAPLGEPRRDLGFVEHGGQSRTGTWWAEAARDR